MYTSPPARCTRAADELLATALDHGLPRLDEKLYLETFSQFPPQEIRLRQKTMTATKEIPMCHCDHLPSVQQLAMSSDRAMLAVLDLSLELTARSLRAEHPALEEQAQRGIAEPPVTHEALAASIIILATSLREVIAGYRDCLDHLLGDRDVDWPF